MATVGGQVFITEGKKTTISLDLPDYDYSDFNFNNTGLILFSSSVDGEPLYGTTYYHNVIMFINKVPYSPDGLINWSTYTYVGYFGNQSDYTSE